MKFFVYGEIKLLSMACVTDLLTSTSKRMSSLLGFEGMLMVRGTLRAAFAEFVVIAVVVRVGFTLAPRFTEDTM